MGEVKKTLSPEFINRIDEIIVFDALSEEQLEAIARIMVRKLNASLEERRLEIAVTDEVCGWLVKTTCQDRSYGARPLRRAIQRYIEDPLSEALIRGHFQERGLVEVYLEDGQPAFRAAIQAPSAP
jgi:ATP-dependent Clp protease ATP-binding subunit ClpC